MNTTQIDLDNFVKNLEQTLANLEHTKKELSSLTEIERIAILEKLEALEKKASSLRTSFQVA